MLPLAEDRVRDVDETVAETVLGPVSETVSETVETEAGASDESTQSDEDSMASSAERMTILRMVEQGKISAEEGARLLVALGDSQASAERPQPSGFDSARVLQVRVTDLVTNRQKVNVNVPVGLFQLAWRWLPISAQDQLEMVQDAIDAGATGRLVEVVDQDSNVRVEVTLL